jgi:phosphoribosylaminoimidazolecarboxamide formyltransferase/IMP cyclohydrolase
MTKPIKTALISVFHKDNLEPVLDLLDQYKVRIFSTGGTFKFIREKGFKVEEVADLTGYPSILDGRVKTLHPKVFGGILARREADHLHQLEQYDIPAIDLVIVDLYPFEKTVEETDDESAIIEKIDIGGVSLIRAAAKNYKDVLIVGSQDQYAECVEVLSKNNGATTFEERKTFAKKAFGVTMHYDGAIHRYFAGEDFPLLSKAFQHPTPLRYGENPHQSAKYYGNLEERFEKLSGKELSYNNLVDVDAAVNLMSEFIHDEPTFAVLKHTNPCGLATRSTVEAAWDAALAGDPVSAFGGILISNAEIDLETAKKIDQIFYEVLIAPKFSEEALNFLSSKKKRILLRIKHFGQNQKMLKTLLDGVIVQDSDQQAHQGKSLETVTKITPTEEQIADLIFANKLVKHLKSNAIALAKGRQLCGIGCGQTSRVDACRQSIEKAQHFEFDLRGAVMASDAFFPFPDSVELAHNAGITSVIQPGGSIKDQLSIDYCNENGLSMVFTGFRHFKH